MDHLTTATASREALINAYQCVRQATETLSAPLATDDFQIQSIDQTSPPKWHMAHVSWLFEAFVLSRFIDGYTPFRKEYDYVFNSYYFTHGKMHPRPQRGLLSRPTVDEVFAYRAEVDRRVCQLLAKIEDDQLPSLGFFIVLGLNHEEQHQELMLMDIKHNFFCNPLKPAYREDLAIPTGSSRELRWEARAGGLHDIGHTGDGFSYDNETPRHQVLVRDHRLADRLITNAEYLEFMQDGGYDNPALWLSDGWATLHQNAWRHPLYWQKADDTWSQFTLGGMRPLHPHEPVCHLSFYEADAYARWAGKRLPSEAELELKLAELPVHGQFLDADTLHPAPAGNGTATSGPGRTPPTPPIPAFSRLQAPWVNTTASLCPTRWCSKAAAASRPPGIRVPPIATFFTRTNAGRLPVCA